MNDGSIEDHLIGITKPSIDRMLKMENPSDCIALYTFYCYTKKWQKNNAVYATSDFAMNAMNWGRDKFSKAKSQLKEAGFIDDVQRKDSTGKVIGWYVGVRFAQNATLGNFHIAELPENHPTGFPQGGSSTVWKNPTQIPITGNEIPNTNNKIQSSSDDFDTFWNAYPKKVAKEQARKAWNKTKPDIAVLLPIIEKFKVSNQWQDKQYIPNPDTFIRNRRWEDEIVITSSNKPNQNNSVQIPSGKIPLWQQIKNAGEYEECKEWLKTFVTGLPTYELRGVEERYLVEFKDRNFVKTNDEPTVFEF
jgi:hypothetical protein